MTNNAAQRAEAPRPNNTGMPDNLKSGIESLSGFSMDDVRVHYNSSKPATVQALAYTQGTDIHVAPGQEKHLPHEAWHVAQQMAGRVSPTTNINGMAVNDNAALEHEADVMGEKAFKQHRNTTQLEKSNLNSFRASSNVTQLYLDPSRLNVVGEDHDESNVQRNDEAVFSRIMTGSNQYKLEHNFFDKNDEYGDPKISRYKQLIIFIEQKIDIIHSNICKQFEILSTINREYGKISKLTLSPHEKYLLKHFSLCQYSCQFQSLPDIITAIKEDKKSLLSTLQKKGLKNLEMINSSCMEWSKLNERILKEKKYCCDFINGIIGPECYEEINKNTLQHGYPGCTFNKFLVGLHARIDWSLNISGQQLSSILCEDIDSYLTNNAEYKKHREATKEIREKVAHKQDWIDVRKERSIAMHNAAQNPKDNSGVWKVGDLHRIDIEKMFPKRNYNLVSQKDFNSELTEWIKNYRYEIVDVIPEKDV